jgi:hypothetical protein
MGNEETIPLAGGPVTWLGAAVRAHTFPVAGALLASGHVARPAADRSFVAGTARVIRMPQLGRNVLERCRACRPGVDVRLSSYPDTAIARRTLFSSELLDFEKSERVDHRSEHLSGNSGVKSSVRSNGCDSQKHFVLAPAVYYSYSVSPLELDDFADQLPTLDEELRESSVDLIQLFSHVGQVVMWGELCHSDHLDIDPA